MTTRSAERGRPMGTGGWLGGPQGPYGEVRKISPLAGSRSPDSPARNESLYQLHYPGPQYHKDIAKFLLVEKFIVVSF
jgi:hypothetical protein